MIFFLRGGVPKFKHFSNLNFFPIRSEGGVVIKFQIFPKFKKVQNILGGGQDNGGLFPLFVTFLNSEASLMKVLCFKIYENSCASNLGV